MSDDDKVTFWAEWHGVRYRLGESPAPHAMRVAHGAEAKRRVQAGEQPLKPGGRVAFEVLFQPYEYTEPGDNPDTPPREGLYVQARGLRAGDYIVVTDEMFRGIVGE